MMLVEAGGLVGLDVSVDRGGFARERHSAREPRQSARELGFYRAVKEVEPLLTYPTAGYTVVL
jgi:hypothetical protein